MTRNDSILHLQWRQLQHDERYHRDILLLSVADRMKHMALHMAKYAGAAVDAQLARDHEKLSGIVVDAFIICLASANTLNLNLSAELSVAAGGASARTLGSIGAELSTELGRSDRDPIWFSLQLCRHAGRLAKACESLDHVEAFPFRDAMKSSVVDIFKTVLAEAAMNQMDIELRSNERLRQVERGSIFDDQYQRGGSRL